MVEPAPSELSRLFPDADINVDAEPCIHGVEALWPEERPTVARAVTKRQREFSSARVCARRLLGRLGIEPAAILPDADRCPQWPSGVVGSISHTREVCLVALAHVDRCRAIGVDIEPHDSIDLELTRTICCDVERAWLAAQPEATRGVWARRFFCAKEAFYKAQFPLTRRKLGFHDVVVEFSEQADPHHDVAFHATVIGRAAEDFVTDQLRHRVALRSAGKLVNGRAHLLAGVAYLADA